MANLKRMIQNVFRKSGYAIQKYPSSPFSSAPVFDLSVQFLMETRGLDVSFIQVGAHNGRYGDPLHSYILKYPWHGILVEPQPDVFAVLCENYDTVKDRLTFENIAVSGSGTEIAMYKAAGHSSHRGDDEWAASVVSVRPRVASRQLGARRRNLEQFVVPCATLDELIKIHSVPSIDVLQIDTEGYDYEVLKTLNLSTISPLIIQFEHGHLSPRDLSGAIGYLGSHGYRTLYGGHQMDTVAFHETFLSSID